MHLLKKGAERNDKKMKSKILKALAVLQAAAVFGGYGVGAVPVSAEEDLGPWSFFAGKIFNYDASAITYSDITTFNYSLRTADNAYGGVTRAVFASWEPNWDAWIKTMPNSADNRFEIKSSKPETTSDNGAGVMFTVPETGLWVAECDALNKGVNGNYGGGNVKDGNAVRICILNNGEVQENSKNCHDFPVREADPQGKATESEKGYYKSDSKLLKPGAKIMLRLSQGIDDWGDSIYLSYKIHKVNAAGDILETYDLNQIGVQTKRTIVPGEDSLTANEIETDNASITGTGTYNAGGGFQGSAARFENWEFFLTDQFYDKETAADRSKDKAFNETSMRENHALFQGGEIAGGVKWIGTQSDYQREGIIVHRYDTYESGDNNWDAGLEIYPGSADKLVRFIPAPRTVNGENKYGVGIRFTVPKDGSYALRTDVKNYGWSVDNKIGYGDDNYARVVFLNGSETTPIADNISVFEIPDIRESGDPFESAQKQLSSGDRIWLELYNGSCADKDDFMGHVIIDRYDELGKLAESYNLGESSFTKLGNWNLFASAKGEEDTFKYVPLQAADVNTLTDTLSGFNSYAARTSSYWGRTSGKVTMKNEAPSFGWNSGDESAVVRTAGDDMIITYDIPEDGTYSIKAATQLLSGTGATVAVSKTIPKKTPLETTAVTPIAQFNATSEKNTQLASAELFAGDRIEFRISNIGDDEAILRINPSIAKVEESISVVSGGVNVSKVNTLSRGSKIDIERNAMSDGAMVAALYEKTDSGLRLIAIDVSNGSGSGLKNFSASVTIPTDADASKAVLKIMMLDLTTLEPSEEALMY